MSDWIIRQPNTKSPNDPYEIFTDEPDFKGVDLNAIPIQFRPFGLIDAVNYVAYRMKLGDRIITY